MPIKDRAARNAYQLAWHAERRASFFAGKSCVKCGSAQQLELDHIDREQKVSHRIWSWSAERRNVEIAKCQVLCHDCHLEKTISEISTANHGDTGSMYRKGCRCDECREAQRLRVQAWRNSCRNRRASTKAA